MKNLFATLFLLLSLPQAFAQNLELGSMTELVNDIEQSQFAYKETGLVFGYFSIHSCLYVSEDMAIFKNYCYPNRTYQARGYTIISAKYGMIDIYEEKIDDFYKRDIVQVEFNSILSPYMPEALPQTQLAQWNGIMETLYNQYNPGCFSTNWSAYTHNPEAQCTASAGTVAGHAQWALETQNLNGNEALWNGLYKTIEKKLNP